MRTLWHDLRYGLRKLVRSPGFTAAAVVSLALGIGATTAIFSVVNAVFLQPIPVAEPGRLVRVHGTDAPGFEATGREFYPTSFSNLDDLRQQADVFSGLAAYVWLPFGLSGDGDAAEQVFGQLVTGNYFDLLGVEAVAGRTFLPEEDSALGAHPVAVVSHRLWRDRFGGDPQLVGRTVRINNQPFTVIGVAPEGFRGVSTIGAPDLWVPMAMRQQVFPFNQFFDQRRWRLFEAVARLAPGVDLERARAAAETVGRRLEQEYPADNPGRGFVLISLTQGGVDPNMRQGFVRAGVLLLATAAMVLLIAYANVANLLLVRATRRRKEIAVRMSVGSTRARLVRQLLTESLLLSLLAAGLGLLIAVWTMNLLWSLRPPFLPENGVDLGLNPRILLFCFGLAIVFGLLFGLAPAWRASRSRLVAELKDAVGEGGRTPRLSLRNLLVVAQVAVSLVALVGAGLFLRSLRNAQAVDLGFDPGNLVAFGVDLAAQGYDEPRGREMHRRLLERIRAVPDVGSAALAQGRPMMPGMMRSLLPEGQEGPENGLLLGVNAVSPGYFSTLGIPLLQGRAFEEADTTGGRPVAVVNRTLAHRLWPGGQAVGRRFTFQGDTEPLEVVGVAGDSKYLSPTEERQGFVYLALGQRYAPRMDLLVRGRTGDSRLLETVRRVVAELDPNLPLVSVEAVEDTIDTSQWGPRMIAALLAGFGALALLLATLGLYATLAYSVQQRTREIGIRSALGAQRRQLLRLVLVQGMSFVAAGVALGAVLAFAGSQIAESLLYGISATDPVTFAAVALLLAAVCLVASILPASRAARVEPLRALRQE